MRRVVLLAFVLLLSGCASKTHIRSTIGTVPPTAINLSGLQYIRSQRVLHLQWAVIGPPLWLRRADDGGLEAIGVLIEPGTWGYSEMWGQMYFPGRTHLIAVSYAPDGTMRRPTDELRHDMDAAVRAIRRVAW